MASGAKVRAGVVGTGHRGEYHVLVYAELQDVELVGVVDTDAERAAAVARQYDTQVFADHRALVGRVDVVSVAVPNGPSRRDSMRIGARPICPRSATWSASPAAWTSGGRSCARRSSSSRAGWAR